MEKGTKFFWFGQPWRQGPLKGDSDIFLKIDKKPAVRQAILSACHSLVVIAAAAGTTTNTAAVTLTYLTTVKAERALPLGVVWASSCLSA